jgi:hypothetical protein
LERNVEYHQQCPGGVQSQVYHTITDSQNAIYNIDNSTFNSTEQLSDISTLFRIIQDSIFNNFDIEPPETSNVTLPDPREEWSKNMDAFMLVESLSHHLSNMSSLMKAP